NHWGHPGEFSGCACFNQFQAVARWLSSEGGSLRMRFLHTALILVLVSSFGFAAFGFAADAAPALLAAGRVDDAISTLQQEISASPNDADRKSTRLNSSHVAISYAVFCLKKKT